MAHTLEEALVLGEVTAEYSKILVPEALRFVTSLQREFNTRREDLLEARDARQKELDAGGKLEFLSETKQVRGGDWQVAPAPGDLDDRRVEITGPVERKMMINALNSGANVFMADFEDALSPTWDNLLQGQLNLIEAVRRKLTFQSPEGKTYKLNDRLATLVVRPRGWHLLEKNVEVDGEPISASLFDFGLFFFHNATRLIEKGSGPYFYLPKLESHLEARLWNDVFNFAQDELKIPRGTIRATILIETILAAFEMEEILYELRDHASGLNAGRWDYMFSMIKKFRNRPDFVLPDRAQVTMTVPFMRAYTELLVKTCHAHGAHAMGGMAAFVPSRKDAKVNEIAFAKVREDKQREAGGGFDGTWVAHPDLVPLARGEFDKVLGEKPNQKEKQKDVSITAQQILDTKIEGSTITEEGLRNNINVGLQYLESWVNGVGAAAIHDLMEDAATAEIARAQIWQWIRNKAKLADGRTIDQNLYKQLRDAELASLGGMQKGRLRAAVELLDSLILTDTFEDFLTVPAYEYLL
jgi:malate synthase